MINSFLDGRVIVKVGDITLEDVDAIVNAANFTLYGGGGVDGAIHTAGGPTILKECRKIRATTHPDGLPTGEAVITTAGNMPAKYVIHTVGPVYNGKKNGRDAELLAAAYRNSLALAVSYDLTTIAFPSISTGAFGYPARAAALVVSETLSLALKEFPSIAEVRLVFFSAKYAEMFARFQIFQP